MEKQKDTLFQQMLDFRFYLLNFLITIREEVMDAIGMFDD